MQPVFDSFTQYKRLPTLEVKVGDLLIGNFHPIRLQTMTTADTMDTLATVEESIRCINAGAELVRITAPSKREAENLLNIKNELKRRGFNTPLVADIHFTPNAAEIAARIVEKVRINPGNYVDKKKFELIEYSDADYVEEIDRIRDRFTPLIRICKEYGTAMRIGTNHGSLSDRIMSRYGDTAIGMVESAMEFLRIAESENYYNIVLSMKSSNPIVMVEAYRLLVQNMYTELGHLYPLHLGVTEAGDGEDGRIKSAMGIGTLLEEGIGDTIRVSLTEDPEFELPVCKDIVKRYPSIPPTEISKITSSVISVPKVTIRSKHETFSIQNIGGTNVPVVIADLSQFQNIQPESLAAIGYHYNEVIDKWNIGDAAADFIYCGDQEISFALPGTLKLIYDYSSWLTMDNNPKCFPLLNEQEYLDDSLKKSSFMNFVLINCDQGNFSEFEREKLFQRLKNDTKAVVCFSSVNEYALKNMRNVFEELKIHEIANPVIITCASDNNNMDETLIHYAIETGALLMDGFGNGIWLSTKSGESNQSNHIKLINSIAFGRLQASRTRISKTEYISCPSCGRTLFDLQTTTAKIRSVTNHLKGVKIAIMGCIVNGPGEMADADFGYVGSGPGKITLYRGKDVVKRNVPAEIAVDELINLLKESNAWIEPSMATV